jgi:hypothetical protein
MSTASALELVELVDRTVLGSSQPWLGRASDGETYVVKFAGAGPGPQALLAELVVNRLAHHWQLPVPDARPIAVRADLPRAGTDEFWDVLDASVGANLAVPLLPGAHNVHIDGSLEASTIDAMLLIDVLFANYDRTSTSRNVLVDELGKHWLIDHGACLFLRRRGQQARFELAENHVLGSQADLARIVLPPAMSLAEVAHVLEDVPATWCASAGLSTEELWSAVHERLEQFADCRGR